MPEIDMNDIRPCRLRRIVNLFLRFRIVHPQNPRAWKNPQRLGDRFDGVPGAAV